jgi:hypothetical protein
MSPADPPGRAGWTRRSVLVFLHALPAAPWLARAAEARPMPRPPAGELHPPGPDVFAAGVFAGNVFE